MDQQFGRARSGLMDPVTEPGRIALAGGLTAIVRRERDEAGAAAERVCREDADYFPARAKVEATRGEEAAHPAARHAHLEMAALYQQRALAARQDEDPVIQDWMSEGGSLLGA